MRVVAMRIRIVDGETRMPVPRMENVLE